MQTWLLSSVGPHLMKLMMPCIFQHVPEELKGWFRQSREEKFKMTLEEVSVAPCCPPYAVGVAPVR